MLNVLEGRFNVYEVWAGSWVIRLHRYGTEEFDGEDGFGADLDHFFESEDAADEVVEKIEEAGEINPVYWNFFDHGCCVDVAGNCGCDACAGGFYE